MARRKLTTTRLSDLHGALAVMVLEARASGEVDADIELVVELPYVSTKTASAASTFMKRVAPEVRFRLEASASNEKAAGAIKSAPTRKGTSDTFTDLNQWMLKYLLLSPDRQRPRSLRALAAAADTSLPTAQRFVDTFTELGHLVRAADGFEVARKDDLMRLWLTSMELTRDWRIPVRGHYGGVRLLEALSKKVAKSEASAALGGFAACEAHRVLHVVEGGPIEVHADGRAMAIVWEHAERVERRDAQLFIVPSAAYAASIFRPLRWQPHIAGAYLPPVDVIQAALDVWSLPAHGGREQARFIVDNVLKWSDGD